MKKYELTDETKIVDRRTLHRIRALRSFGDVREGELGGWVESEKNLSHRGNCWVYKNAAVYNNARVAGDARVCDNALVAESALVCGEARVCNNARMFGNARIYESALVCGEARVYGSAKVYGNAQVHGYAVIYGYSCLSGDTILKFSEPMPIWFSDIKLDHGTWEDVIEINDKKYLVSNMLDLYEVPG